MARYSRIPTSLPDEERGVQLAPLAPLEADGHDTIDDQNERLSLAGGKDEATRPGVTFAGAVSFNSLRPLLSDWKPMIWPFGLLTGFVFGLLFVLRVMLFDMPEFESVSFRRPNSDYLLDPEWDFDALPQIREYNWTIKDIYGNPDGVFRGLVTINGKFPGELIECNQGDFIVVNVENLSQNATSIHWHGIFQNGSNWMDGTPGVTSCPIAPGYAFQYKFTVTGQAGTYFYHAHHGAQALDGLVGPLVIHSRDELAAQEVPYASEQVVMVQDWYHDPSHGLLYDSLSSGNEGSPIPNGALINGANWLDCSHHPHRNCDSESAFVPWFDLAPGENHRLRILNVGGFAWFEITIDSHPTLYITEVDGTNVEPSPSSSVLVGPGQRYSVVLPAKTEPDTPSYWLRARILTTCFATQLLPESGLAEARAILRYISDDSALAIRDKQPPLPTTVKGPANDTIECKDMKQNAFAPSPPRAAPGMVDQSWYLRVNLEIGDWQLERGFLNASSFRPNLQSPILHRVVDGLSADNTSFGMDGVNAQAFHSNSELVISQEKIEVVDIILQNFDEGNHPFHLHGMPMFVLASGHGYWPGYEALGMGANGQGLLDPKNSTMIDNPLRRDVATVEGFGWVLIRFVADNPGVWFFHCHMIWHGEAGMSMQFLSRLDKLKKWKIPPANRHLCQAELGDLEKGATPKDDIWFGWKEGG